MQIQTAPIPDTQLRSVAMQAKCLTELQVSACQTTQGQLHTRCVVSERNKRLTYLSRPRHTY